MVHAKGLYPILDPQVLWSMLINTDKVRHYTLNTKTEEQDSKWIAKIRKRQLEIRFDSNCATRYSEE
jgi:hypothetical protein